MANVFGESSEVTKTFQRSVDRLSLGGRVIVGVVNRLVETILRDHANVGDLTDEHPERSFAVEGWGREPVENVGDILETEVPHVRWGVGGVHRAVDGTFDILPATFGMVLVLVVGFTLPIGNDKGAQNIVSSFADLISTVVTGKFIHGTTTFTYDVFKGVDELLGTVHRKDVNNVCVAADED